MKKQFKFEVVYAYATSPWAEKLKRGATGCYCVKKQDITNYARVAKLAAGPFETKEQATAAAEKLQSALQYAAQETNNT